MTHFENFVRQYMPIPVPDCKNFSPSGKTFTADTEEYRGCYWFYENPSFIIDIQDCFIKKDCVGLLTPSIRPYIFLISSYLISGSGEWMDPYQTIEPDSILIMGAPDTEKRYILHGNCRFFVVGIKYKETMIEEYFLRRNLIKRNELYQVFTKTKKSITRPIHKIAREILDCRMEGLSAELFFEAKAKEWLSITLDAYQNNKEELILTDRDKNSIESIARYIEDHYAYDIPQEFLEKAAAMSGTKLKTAFRQRYNMSITEFTQRKRMNIAESLLLTTNLEINDIAETVGYSSPSRFSTLFRRYKGMYPRELKKLRRQAGK